MVDTVDLSCFIFSGELVLTGRQEYNLAKNAMPYLHLPREAPVPEELEQIQPLLDHIHASLCAGDIDIMTAQLLYHAFYFCSQFDCIHYAQ